jgi:hypothetical protein
MEGRAYDVCRMDKARGCTLAEHEAEYEMMTAMDHLRVVVPFVYYELVMFNRLSTHSRGPFLSSLAERPNRPGLVPVLACHNPLSPSHVVAFP